MEDLVVFSRTYDLLLWLVPAVERFPRRQRYVLGERVQRSALDVLECIISAHSGLDRPGSLRRASVELDRLRVLMRLALDMRLVSPGAHGHFAVMCDEVGRLLGGWLRSCRRSGPQGSRRGGPGVAGAVPGPDIARNGSRGVPPYEGGGPSSSHGPQRTGGGAA